MEGVLSLEGIRAEPELAGFVKNLTADTLEKLVAIRDKEGKALNADVARHLATIKKEILKVNVATKAAIKEKEKSLPEEEYSIFLKNTDVSEELARINYHLKNFKNILGRAVSCGKELDFISQEIQREANTISAKAQDARVSSSIIKIKSAIDKIREQLQNAE